MPDIESAYLTCESCGTLAVHAVSYAGRLVVSTRCSACGTVVARNPAQARTEYFHDLEQRLQSKPQRLLRHALRDPKGFLTTLPAKVAAQPRKLAREWRNLASASRTRQKPDQD